LETTLANLKTNNQNASKKSLIGKE